MISTVCFHKTGLFSGFELFRLVMELHNPFSYQESKLKWADMSINMDDPSYEITSEEETGSDFGSESNSRPIPVLQIWNPDTVETEILVSGLASIIIHKKTFV